MNEKRIRVPKFPVFYYLFNCFSNFTAIFSVYVLAQFTAQIQSPAPMALLNSGLIFICDLFFAIVLLKRKYDITLVIASVLPLARCAVGCIINLNASWILSIFYYILLAAFAYLMIKKPDTPIREKAVKLRFIFPIYELIAVAVSTIELLKDLTERLSSTGNDALMNMTLAIPTLLSAVAGFLPFVSCILLINWMADPYEKQK